MMPDKKVDYFLKKIKEKETDTEEQTETENESVTSEESDGSSWLLGQRIEENKRKFEEAMKLTNEEVRQRILEEIDKLSEEDKEFFEKQQMLFREATFRAIENKYYTQQFLKFIQFLSDFEQKLTNLETKGNKNFEEIIPIIQKYRSTVESWQQKISATAELLKRINETENKRQKMVDEFKLKLNAVIQDAERINRENEKMTEWQEKYNKKIVKMNEKIIQKNKEAAQKNKLIEEHNAENREYNAKMGYFG